MSETRELVPLEGTVALPITVDQAVQQWKQYQDLTRELLDPSDYQAAPGGKRFKKKSAWRKYARAFNIADEVTFEEIKRDERGFPLWARVRVRATAPNGRQAEADHECHITERCCDAAWGEPCPKKQWRNHTCCGSGCSGRRHWSHPGDLPATALTRAKNRAISDLIGAGEVSAEEMESERAVEAEVVMRGNGRPAARQQPTPAATAAEEPLPEATPAPRQATLDEEARTITDSQANAIRSLLEKVAKKDAAVHEETLISIGVLTELSEDEAATWIGRLNRMVKP